MHMALLSLCKESPSCYDRQRRRRSLFLPLHYPTVEVISSPVFSRIVLSGAKEICYQQISFQPCAVSPELSAAELQRGLLTPRTFPLSMQINVALSCYLLWPLHVRRKKKSTISRNLFACVRRVRKLPSWRCRAGRIDKGQQRQRPAKELDLDLLHAVEQGTIVHKG